MSERTRQQELNFIGQLHAFEYGHVPAFAYAAAVAVRRGHVFRYTEQIGADPLQICTTLRRTLVHLRRAGELADAYGKPDTAEFTHAAWLAVACFGMQLETIVASIESADRMLKTLGPTGRFARALAEWRPSLGNSATTWGARSPNTTYSISPGISVSPSRWSRITRGLGMSSSRTGTSWSHRNCAGAWPRPPSEPSGVEGSGQLRRGFLEGAETRAETRSLRAFPARLSPA